LQQLGHYIRTPAIYGTFAKPRKRVLRAEVLNMRLQGQRLTEYVNTKWEEMIRDWRALMLKEQQHSYQHSVENEWMVTQHRHKGMLFASVNGFISQFALESAIAHGNLTARSSLPACSGTHHLGKIAGTSLTVDDFNATGISDVET